MAVEGQGCTVDRCQFGLHLARHALLAEPSKGFIESVAIAGDHRCGGLELADVGVRAGGEASALAPDAGWQEETLGALDAAFAAYKNRAFAYELVVVEQLTGIWRRIVTKNRAELALTKPDAGDERIKQMLVFLQQNYTRRVTLKEIAASAHISERACTRCFQEKLRQSPFTYLNALRVRAAADKLHSGDLPVSAIAEAVGFETGSYFSKVFRAAVGCSPRAYRSRLIAGETGAGRNPPGPSEEPGG